jgi:hypothetical protein
MKNSDLCRELLSTCTAVAMLAGCGGAQMQPTGSMQTTGQIVERPDVAVACPSVGKKYTTGTANGRVSMKFFSRQVSVRDHSVALRVELIYSDWPEDRPLVGYILQLITCGPQGGKKPAGEAAEGSGSTHSKCENGICTIAIYGSDHYTPPRSLPGNKPWRFDYIIYKPMKSTRGYGALPSWRIQVNP